jgi:Ribbon-helix-helix protein, copG family
MESTVPKKNPEEQVPVHEGRRAGVVVSVRLKADEADLLEALAARDGRTLSETLRSALHAYSRVPLPPRRDPFGPFTRGGTTLELVDTSSR